MKFELTILGTSAAVPYHDRWLAGQFLNIQDHYFLIDCGEGTQFRIKELGLKISKVNHIFISHLHGDHCFGLFGILTSMAMSGRKDALNIFSPVGLEDMVKAVFYNTQYVSPFPIHFNTVNTEGVTQVLENQQLTVETVPLKHRIPTVGYIFKEKPFLLNIRPEKIEAYNIPFSEIKKIKGGADFNTLNGETIPNAELTLPPIKPRSFAYCSDTSYLETLIPHIQGVDLLYHEATFSHDMAAHAEMTGHSTAQQAATIAQKANVKKLVIGHFSSRYTDLTVLLNEAKLVFENTVLGIDKEVYVIEILANALKIAVC
jgi:ribonuclease Z